MHEELEGLANLRIGKGIERAARVHGERTRQIKNEFVRRGLARSGPAESALIDSFGQLLDDVCRTIADTWVDLILRSEKHLSEDSVRFIMDRVENSAAIQVKTQIANRLADDILPREFREQQLQLKQAGIVAGIRRDLEIRRKEQELFPKEQEPSQLRALEKHSENKEMASDFNTIFVSCGQFTEEERKLGHRVCALIEELTTFRPYFADAQSSLQGLTDNILGALSGCVGFIAIMHPRGRVAFPDGPEHTRGSIWIEQEIAIAAFITQILKKDIHVAAYFHRNVKREGMRDQLHLNPVFFENNEDILNSLRQLLPTWTTLRAPQNQPIEVSIDYRENKLVSKPVPRDWAGDWKEVASNFRAEAERHVGAQYQKHATLGESWRLSGDREAVRRVEALCKHAGSLLAASPKVAKSLSAELLQRPPMDRWLFNLKDRTTAFEYNGNGVETLDSGEKAHIFLGTIRDVAEVAANMCMEYAGEEY